jgi:nicotinate phosphoribosyltransferase
MDSLALHTDKYEINMMYAHWLNRTHQRKAVFDVYIRKLPFDNGYAVFAGLKRIVDYLQQLSFSDEEIAYLAAEEHYDPAFLDYLRQLRFTGDLWSVKEGEIVFAGEPWMRIEAPAGEAHLIETALLNMMNYQTLVATKAARIRQAAGNDTLLEFGSRRAQEVDAAIWGTRAAYLAGFDATSNLKAAMMFGIPSAGTHAHAWVQMHDSELDAFQRFAAALPEQTTLLVDTYDTLRSGIPNAIETAKRLAERGKRLKAIRLDSGDLAYLSIRAREMLDAAGLTDVKIAASSDLDELTIIHLKTQGARIDQWGVGTRLITCEGQPSLGGVYKLAAREREDGELEPALKISSNPAKISTPGVKNVYRIISEDTGKAIADYVCLAEEGDLSEAQELKLFNPEHPYLSRKVRRFRAVPLLTKVIEQGRLTCELPSLAESRAYHLERKGEFWPEYMRTLNPEVYHVHLSERLWNLKRSLIERYSFGN